MNEEQHISSRIPTIVHATPVNPCSRNSVRGWASFHTPLSLFVLALILWQSPLIQRQYTLIVLHSLAMAPTPLETVAASALESSLAHHGLQWSKEEIFGLLGVLCVVLVPCLGFALKCFIAKCWSASRRERRHPGAFLSVANPQFRIDHPPAEHNAGSSFVGSGRRKKLRSKGTRNNTIVVIY